MATGIKKGDADVLYLYGVSQNSHAPAAKMIGIDGAALVEPLRFADLVCWICRVSKDGFADQLSDRMQDLDWLAETTPRHQSVLAAIGTVNDVLPTRFGTVFLNESSLRADIEKRKPVLLADLKRIRGNEEWGVKVFSVRPEVAEINSVRNGKSYLEAKSALLRARSSAKDDGEIKRFAKELENFSVDTAAGGKISSGRPDLRFQVSLLLRRSDREKFASMLKRFEKEWKNTRHIECSGPWPPYSFVTRTFE
jgi:Gas vesicle synthesis protein GvpL/GvpF